MNISRLQSLAVMGQNYFEFLSLQRSYEESNVHVTIFKITTVNYFQTDIEDPFKESNEEESGEGFF